VWVGLVSLVQSLCWRKTECLVDFCELILPLTPGELNGIVFKRGKIKWAVAQGSWLGVWVSVVARGGCATLKVNGALDTGRGCWAGQG
jgi:hypothetical protein